MSSSAGSARNLKLTEAKALFSNLDQIKLNELTEYESLIQVENAKKTESVDTTDSQATQSSREAKIDVASLVIKINACLQAAKTLNKSVSDEFSLEIFHSLPDGNSDQYLISALAKLHVMSACFNKNDPKKADNQSLLRSLSVKISLYAENSAIKHLTEAVKAISALEPGMLMSFEAAYRDSKKYEKTIQRHIENNQFTMNLNLARREYDQAFNLLFPPGIFWGGDAITKKIETILNDMKIRPQVLGEILSKLDYMNSIYYMMHEKNQTDASQNEAINLAALQTALMAIVEDEKQKQKEEIIAHAISPAHFQWLLFKLENMRDWYKITGGRKQSHKDEIADLLKTINDLGQTSRPEHEKFAMAVSIIQRKLQEKYKKISDVEIQKNKNFTEESLNSFIDQYLSDTKKHFYLRHLRTLKNECDLVFCPPNTKDADQMQNKIWQKLKIEIELLNDCYASVEYVGRLHSIVISFSEFIQQQVIPPKMAIETLINEIELIKQQHLKDTKICNDLQLIIQSSRPEIIIDHVKTLLYQYKVSVDSKKPKTQGTALSPHTENLNMVNDIIVILEQKSTNTADCLVYIFNLFGMDNDTVTKFINRPTAKQGMFTKTTPEIELIKSIRSELPPDKMLSIDLREKMIEIRAEQALERRKLDLAAASGPHRR